MLSIRFSHLSFSLLLSLSCTIKSSMILYGNELSLTLLKNGVSQFIHEGKNQSIEEYKTALNDVINCKSWNGTNIELLFENVGRHLKNNIIKINSLEGKNIDSEYLMWGIGSIGLGLGLTYATYYNYINNYQPNRNEYKKIIKHLEDNGVKVEDRGDIHLTVPPGKSYRDNKKSYHDKGQQLLELNKAKKEIVSSGEFGLALLCTACFFGIAAIIAAFNPHLEDKYLEKYKEMLAIVIELQQKYCAGNIYPSLFKI